MTTHKTSTSKISDSIMITIDNEISERMNNILPNNFYLGGASSAVYYGIECLLDIMNSKKGVPSEERKLVGLAIAEYAPYKFDSNPVKTSIRLPSGIKRTEFSQSLREVGFSLVPLCKAFYSAIVNNGIQVIPERNYKTGFLVLGQTPGKIYQLKNVPFHVILRLSDSSITMIDRIEHETGKHFGSIVRYTIETLFDIESGELIHNRDSLMSYILKRGYMFESVKGNNIKHLGSGTRKTPNLMKSGVKSAIIIEKHKLDGRADLAYRIVKFIIDSYAGDINLKKIRIDDDEDYNETMLIRNAYRKEVAYAAARY